MEKSGCPREAHNLGNVGSNPTPATKDLGKPTITALHPGHKPGCSFGAKGTIRISYATSMEELVVAMDKLTRFLEGKRVGK